MPSASATTLAITSAVSGPGTVVNGSAGISASAAATWLAHAMAKLGTPASLRLV